MSKKIEETVPVSKYAAKKANRVKAEVEETKNDVVETTKEDASVEEKNTPVAQRFYKKDKKNKGGIPVAAAIYPEHVVHIALLIKNNAEIRRFTSLGILNYLLQKGEIKGEHRFVSFKWNKFAVKCNGLVREFSYNEPFFLNALVAAFTSFSASAQRIIDAFCRKEMSVGITKAVDKEEVDNIAALNEQYQETGEVITEEDNAAAE